MAERQVERGREWLEKLLGLMGMSAEVRVGKNEDEPESSSWWLIINEIQLNPQQIASLLGKQGESLDAIQYLANTLLNLGLESNEQRAFTVELNDYRRQRQQELFTWAKQVAEQVRQTGQEVEMMPLSSAERRQIHTFLKDEADLATESRGQEPHRRLVVKLHYS